MRSSSSILTPSTACRKRRWPGRFTGIPTLDQGFSCRGGPTGRIRQSACQGLSASPRPSLLDPARDGGLVNVGRTASSEFGVAGDYRDPALRRHPQSLARGHERRRLQRRGGRGGGRRHRALRARQRRRWFNPQPCRILRSDRPEAVARPRHRLPGAKRRCSASIAFMLTRSVRDTALLLDLCQGPEAGDGYEIAPPERAIAPRSMAGRRGVEGCALPGAWSELRSIREVAAATRAIAKKLEALGHDVEEASPASTTPPSCSAESYLGGRQRGKSASPGALLGRPMDETPRGERAGAPPLRRGAGAADLMNAIACTTR